MSLLFFEGQSYYNAIYVDIRTIWKAKGKEDSGSFFMGCELHLQISGTDCYRSETRRVLTFKAKLILRQMSLLCRCENRKTPLDQCFLIESVTIFHLSPKAKTRQKETKVNINYMLCINHAIFCYEYCLYLQCTSMHWKAVLTHTVVLICSAECTQFDKKHSNWLISNICWIPTH